MPRLRLPAGARLAPIPVEQPAGGQLLLPRLQFRCLVRLPGVIFPYDGVIDTGSPFSWFPHEVWSRFGPGTDFEWLPFSPGYLPPLARTAGWTFRFRIARMLVPVTLLDASTEVHRDRVIVQLADGNPSRPTANAPAVVVLGLWGGILEGTRLHIDADPATGGLSGTLEF